MYDWLKSCSMQRKIKINGAIFFACLLIIGNHSQSQSLEVGYPIKLPDHINSEAEEIMPILLPGDTTLFFTRTFHPQNVGGLQGGQDIWSSRRNESGLWLEPSNNYPEWNNRSNNSIIGIREHAQTTFLTHSYSSQLKKNRGISFSTKVGNEWSKPEKIPIKGLKSDGFYGFHMNPTYDVLIISMQDKNSLGQEDLYISFKKENDRWTKPVNLGPSVNTPGYEISPFLADDNQTLFFASNGHPGYGDADIFVTQRQYDSWENWSRPVNLGKIINSEKFDAYFSITKNNEIFFSSNREDGNSNIYQTYAYWYLLGQPTDQSYMRLNEVARTEIEGLFGSTFPEVISFGQTSDRLTALAREQIDFITKKIIEFPEYKVELVGSSYDESSVVENFKTSINIAILVREYFNLVGLPYDRIYIRGIGNTGPESYPKNSNQQVIINILK